MLENDNFDFIAEFGIQNLSPILVKHLIGDMWHLRDLFLPSVRARQDQISAERENNYQIFKHGAAHSIVGALKIRFELAADPCDNGTIHTHGSFYGVSLILRLEAEAMHALVLIVACGFDEAAALYGNGEKALTVRLMHVLNEPFLVLYKTAPVLQVSDKIVLSRSAFLKLRSIIVDNLRFLETLVCTGRALNYIVETNIMKFVGLAMDACVHCHEKHTVDAVVVRKTRAAHRIGAIDFLVCRHDCVKGEVLRSIEIGEAVLTIFEQDPRLLIKDIDAVLVANLVQASVTRRLRELNRNYLRGTIMFRR